MMDSGPTVRGRASIIHAYLEVQVLEKSQLQKAIEWLIENEYCFEWEVEKGDSIELDKFTLVVKGICWAHNLSTFAKILEECDYKSNLL